MCDSETVPGHRCEVCGVSVDFKFGIVDSKRTANYISTNKLKNGTLLDLSVYCEKL